ncbi:protein phosphatase 1 regulatory subunit 37-like isoform X2 [Amphibalanus amphitrite]|nr:protein phosphatase 1 regulatory subunit 37-like isoform X2 [Amphibalanus amphitrite]XP_043195090.1 protein phosphatase 1 regulatory subunit 37-like isoform X2 [Amphibalanus amphitrite]XP_043195091.1 protein phosphatase 1 regulatory subunit 37-like isoform X2 [Amphibalanus amphitrite]
MESEEALCAGGAAGGALPPASSGPGRPSPALSSDTELETEAHHSSEEELEGFNCREREKRKWCQVKRTSRDSSCSSDEEMAPPAEPTSPAPVQFRSSPPAGAHRPGRTSPPPRRAAAAPPPPPPPPPTTPSTRGRKRRRGLGPLGAQRPCLDFEKMQQEGMRSVTTWRPSAELSLFCW